MRNLKVGISFVVVACIGSLLGGCGGVLENQAPSALPDNGYEQSQRQAAAVQEQIDADQRRRDDDQAQQQLQVEEQSKQLQDQINAQSQQLMQP